MIKTKQMMVLDKGMERVPLIFTRASIAYNNMAEIIPANTPRLRHYLGGEYVDALLIEEGTLNVVASNIARGTDESGTTSGFATYTGGVISSSVDYAKEGTRSLKTITPGSAVGEGNYARLSGLDAGVHTGSMWVKTSEGAKIRLLIGNGNSYPTGTGEEQYCTATGTCAASDRLYLITSSAVAAQAITMYEDMVQVEKKAYPTSWQKPGTARSAESLTIPTHVINPNEGTIEFEAYITHALKSTSGEKYLIDITGSDGYLRLYKADGSDVFKFDSNDGEHTDSIESGALTLGTWYRFAVTWGDTTKLYINGTLIGTGENGYKPSTLTTFNWGSLNDGTLQCNTYTRKTTIHERELSATEISIRDTEVANGKNYNTDRTTTFILSCEGDLRGFKPSSKN